MQNGYFFFQAKMKKDVSISWEFSGEKRGSWIYTYITGESFCWTSNKISRGQLWNLFGYQARRRDEQLNAKNQRVYLQGAVATVGGWWDHRTRSMKVTCLSDRTVSVSTSLASVKQDLPQNGSPPPLSLRLPSQLFGQIIMQVDNDYMHSSRIKMT